MAPLRLGIVGANAERGWARDAHMPALRLLPQDFVVEAVSARTQANADAAAAALGVTRAFADSLALVRDPSVDAIAITVKVPEHCPLVLGALAAGKHVYCEWPLGRDVKESAEMAAAVPAGVHTMIGTQAVVAPAVRVAARLVADGAIGKPKVLRAYNSAAAWGAETTSFYAYLQDKTTGATLETIGGGHMLAAIDAIVGPYTDVDARTSIFRRQVRVADTGATVERTCPDHMLVLGEHASGCVSTLEVSGEYIDKITYIEVIGDEGWIRLEGKRRGTCQTVPLALTASFPVDPLPAEIASHLTGAPVNLAEAYALFAADIRSGQHTVPDFDDALRLTRLLAAVDAASTERRRMSVDSIH